MVLKLDKSSGSRRDVVVMTHGWLAGRRSMRPLCQAVRQAGYHCINWGYPSLTGSITDHAARLSQLLTDLFVQPDVARVHLITHSMGGIVARSALCRSRLESSMAEKCGRFVMLAPPNAGSHLTRLPLGPLSCWFPQLQELSERPDSLVNQLPMPRRMHVGVIAAARDFVVSKRSTYLACQRDHAVVSTTHQRLVAHPSAIEMTVRFVESGRLRSATVASPATLPFPSQTREPMAA